MKNLYSSDAMLMVRLNSVDFSNLPSVIGGLPSGEGLNLVHSETQILASEEIAREVVEQLDLSHRPGFLPGPSLLDRARIVLSGSPAPLDPATVERDRMAAAIGQYLKGLSVYNDGKSYIIQIGFSGPDGALAQKILTAHLGRYLQDQDAAKQAIIARAQHWLDNQLRSLEAQVGVDERDLQVYVEAHHLSRTQFGTIGTHELGSMTTQLADAQSDLARKQAYLDEINGTSRHSGADISNSTVLGSSTIQRLREQEGIRFAAVTSLQQQYGSNNPAVLNARGALNGVRAAISAEMARMRAAAQSDVGVAHANVTALTQSMRRTETDVGGEENAEVVLDEKQRKLDVERTLYSDLLSRSKQVAIQRETQEANAYVVSPPTRPLQPSAPRRGLLIALGLCVSAVISGTTAFVIGTFRSRSVSLEAIEQRCGIVGIGNVPTTRTRGRRSGHALCNIMAPLSRFASSIQTLGNSLLHAPAFPNPQVIAVMSPLPGDGKTMLTACLGRSFAMSGRRVLLIDGDFRKPQLARMLCGPAPAGIFEVLEKRVALQAVVKRVDELGMDVLPVETGVVDFFRYFRDDTLNSLLDQARADYDIVLIDTSSLAIVDDSLALMRAADLTVCVARCGKTSYEEISKMTRRLLAFDIPCAGIVLNGTAPARRSARVGATRRYFRASA